MGLTEEICEMLASVDDGIIDHDLFIEALQYGKEISEVGLSYNCTLSFICNHRSQC